MGKVELWMQDAYFGVLLPRETGVLWSNQIGGTACGHPEMEGFYIPLGTELPTPVNDPLFEEYWVGPVEQYQRSRVELFLGVQGWLQQCFEPLSGWSEIPPLLPCVAGEAWVPVRLKDHPMTHRVEDILLPFAGSVGVLVYVNSD